jgi:RND superfamily putative drug exporter
LLLGVAATLALTNGGKLTTSISINGVPAQVVIDQLKKNFPEASRGSGQAVLQKADGSKFNNADIAAVTAALEDVEKLEGISGTLNPFTIQSEIEDRRQEAKDGEADLVQAEKDLVSGQTEIVTNRKKIADGEKALDEAEAKLKVQSTQLEAGIAQATAAGAPQAQIDALIANRAQISGGLAEIKKQRATLVSGERQLVTAQVKVDSGKTDIESGKTELAVAKQILEASANFSTVSKDGTVALATVQFTVPGADIEEPIRESVVESLKAANLPGINIEFSQDLTRSISGILGIGEVVGLAIASIVLFVFIIKTSTEVKSFSFSLIFSPIS